MQSPQLCLNPQIVFAEQPPLPSVIPESTLINNIQNNISPTVKSDTSNDVSSSEISDETPTEQPYVLCKYCKKENVSMKGKRLLKTCKTCLRKKKEYEESRGKSLRSERVKMYTERYSTLCSTCHTRRAMRKDGRQLHTCQRCAKYKRSQYQPKKADLPSPSCSSQNSK